MLALAFAFFENKGAIFADRLPDECQPDALKRLLDLRVILGILNRTVDFGKDNRSDAARRGNPNEKTDLIAGIAFTYGRNARPVLRSLIAASQEQ